MPRRPRRHDRTPPELFLDRSLGRYVVAEALRAVGLVVHPMFEVYPDVEERLEDAVWIREVSDRGWVILAKDDAIRRKPAERDALMAGNARAFVVTNRSLGGIALAQLFVTNRHRITQRSRQPGPYVYRVGTDGLSRLFP